VIFIAVKGETTFLQGVVSSAALRHRAIFWGEGWSSLVFWSGGDKKIQKSPTLDEASYFVRDCKVTAYYLTYSSMYII
jgi:hypothetical protein